MTAQILIVEDDQDVGETMSDIVSTAGFAATVVSDLDHVKNSLHEDDYALVCLDLFLNTSDGIEILRYLAEAGCKAPIVLTSGAADNLIQTGTRMGRAMGLNMLQPMPKPVDTRRFIDLLGSIKPAITAAVQVTEFSDVPLHEELERAILKDEFVVHYQPKVDPALWEGGIYKVEGAEALVRWQHPRRGLLMPASFIPYAEKTDLIAALTHRIVERVFGQMAIWEAEGVAVPVSINLTPALLTSVTLPDEFAALAQRHGIKPEHITFEITETAALEQSAQVMDILTRLTMKGFSLSLDDFGCGYASLASLASMPFSEVKIDRCFVVDMAEFKKSEAITRAMITLGHDLGLRVCAEGVERTDVAERLIDMGCDVGQGYLFGRPMPAHAFADLLLSTSVPGAMLSALIPEIQFPH